MLETLRQHPLSLAVSIVGHLVLIGALIYNFDSLNKSSSEQVQVEPIKAVAVDEELVRAEMEKLKQAENNKLQQEQAAVEKRERELKTLEKKRKAEEQRLQQVQRRLQQEEEKLKREKASREKLAREQAAKLKKQKSEAAKKQKEARARRQAEAEKERKEKERKEKKRLEEEKLAESRRQQEQVDQLERERVAELERAREREIALMEEKEAQRLADLAVVTAEAERKERRRLDGLRAEYKIAIGQKVSRNWINPDNSGENIECTVVAIQIPSGLVVDVNVLSCTGGSARLPSSVESAVRKASPLPLPKDPVLFERQLEFVFRPE
jgi:colicin import membrane protein